MICAYIEYTICKSKQFIESSRLEKIFTSSNPNNLTYRVLSLKHVPYTMHTIHTRTIMYDTNRCYIGNNGNQSNPNSMNYYFVDVY